MYSQHHAPMAPPQKPETFMLSSEAQQSLPQDAQVALQQVDNLKYFLISAPVDWTHDQYIRRFLLPTGEYVSCVLWNNLFHISGTDIVRCLSFRFQAFGRPVKNSKKFEEGIFSDLRNLKSGTDASLEEPKSAFLDFLYKNNCIRTQKKQKVFYWFSVPHDRLFLDALERDLKREKMGQEATTMAVNEPALSFEFDSSQSLFEQLTKTQQANSSSFSAHQPSYAQSQSQSQAPSPVLRALDTMPPPQMVPQSLSGLSDDLGTMAAYQQMTMAAPSPIPGPNPVHQLKREDFPRVQYNQNGVPISQAHARHASLPAYGMEYSPAPSFVSSHYEDYSNRGISFEPITPPQQSIGLGGEPAYIANEETGLFTAIPDHLNGVTHLSGMMQLPPSNLANPAYGTANRAYTSNNVYSVIEGSPTYKQRRRRSSIPPGMSHTSNPQIQPHAVHRPSDLRRSVSHSVGPVAEGDESTDDLGYTQQVQQMPRQHESSRHPTPLPTIEDSPAMNPVALQHPEYHARVDGQESSIHDLPPQRPNMAGSGGAIRHRARSATMLELGPYPQKSHSCPIPTCGRLFKRLEHLKRHVRTHTQEKPYVCSSCGKAFSRSDNLAQHKRTHDRTDGGVDVYGNYSGEEDEFEGENDDLVEHPDELSPNSENGFLPGMMPAVQAFGEAGDHHHGGGGGHVTGSMDNMASNLAASNMLISGVSGGVAGY